MLNVNITSHTHYDAFVSSFFLKVAERSMHDCMHMLSISKNIKSPNELLEKIERCGYVKKCHDISLSQKTILFLKEDDEGTSLLYGSFYPNDSYFALSFYSSSKAEKELVFDLIKGLETPEKSFSKSGGDVYVLANTPIGLKADFFGTDFQPIIRENYSEEVLESYDRTVQQFSAPNSDGFISIFSGLPGGGKTYLIRGLMSEIKDALFLYVPAQLVSEFGSPSLVGVLRDLSKDINDDDDDDEIEFQWEEGYEGPKNPGEITAEMSNDYDAMVAYHKMRKRVPKKKKIVIILEDADLVLSPRNQTDINGISTLLNMTDGILGKILNVRIVATTNSDAKSFDKAIMRDGRLCSHCIIQPLSYDHAQEIFEREGGSGTLPIRNYLLAEIYKLAKNKELTQRETQNAKRNRIGF